jgi:hypothetical protein
MKNEVQDILDHVYDLNLDYARIVFEYTGKEIDYYPYQYITNSASFQITFFDQIVFCSENDCHYDDDNKCIIDSIMNDNTTKILSEIIAYAKARDNRCSSSE